MNKLINIDIATFTGEWPRGKELVVYEKGGDPDDGVVLYGFDEVGEFDGRFQNPQYCFC